MTLGSNNHKQLSIAASALVFIYIAVRSATVPISHDEAVTFFLYLQPGEFFPHNMIWDANNHILNSILTYPLFLLFGEGLITHRLPNVLSFVLYAYFVYKLTAGIRNPWPRNIGLLAMLSPALLIELFAQSRGYGLGMSFFAGAIYFMSQYMQQGRPRQQLLMWGFLAFALMANMSLLNAYLIAIGLVLIKIWMGRMRADRVKQVTIFVTTGVLPFIAYALYAFKMKEGGLLYYGDKEGFAEVTLRTLNKYSIYTDAMWAAWLIAALMACAGAYLIYHIFKDKFEKWDTGKVAAAFLIGLSAGAILLCLLLDVNYPEDRTGIFYLPLFILTLAYAIDNAAQNHSTWRFASVALCAYPLALVFGASLYTTSLWKELHLDHKLYEKMQLETGADFKSATIEGYRLFASSWGYNMVQRPQKLQPLIPDVVADARADYALCHEERCKAYQADYDTLLKADGIDTYLMKRRDPYALEWFHSVEQEQHVEGNGFYFDFIHTDDRVIIDNVEMIELGLSITSERVPLLVDVLFTARNDKDETIYMDFASVNWIHPAWKGDTLELRRFVNFPPETDKIVCYLWNIKKNDLKANFFKIDYFKAPNDSSTVLVQDAI